jgi:triacylglycerol lipase
VKPVLKAVRSALSVIALLLACVAVGATGVAWWQTTKQAEVPASDGAPGQRAHTRYPIVLVHGLLGFDHLGAMSYWYDIVPRLRAQGADVHTTSVAAFDDSEVRGQELLPQIQKILHDSGAGKVHLIGHSQGSLAARYVAAVRPDLVASVTSVAGPNQGSEVADWLVRQDRDHPILVSLLLSLAEFAGHVVNVGSGRDWPQRPRDALNAVSSPGVMAFNQRYPAGVPAQPCGEGAYEVNGIRYYSWTGVGRFYRAVNAADSVMWMTGQLFEREADNDGLVGRCASHLGQVLGDRYPMNHLHAVRLLFGLTPAMPDGLDPATLYLAHAERLKAAGL